MVTNAKIENTTAANVTPHHDSTLDNTFVGVLRRRGAPSADLEQLRTERLATWEALGRELEAAGWQNLETALDAARAAVHRERFHVSAPQIGAVEAEQLAARFADDCARIVDAGGAMTLWHIVVADLHTPHAELDDFTDGRTATDPVSDVEAALLVDAARCYALAAIAGVTSSVEWENLRVLFGPDANDADVDYFAPFAIDNDPDGYASVWRDSASMFATARTNADRLEATERFAYGFEGAATSYTLRPAQRLGLIAWLARNGLELELGGEA